MKHNGPCTGVEVMLDDEDVIISKTDTKGIITSANDSFVKLSGFTEYELIGKSHNIVRHPEMPRWAFEDLWNTLKSHSKWEGIVKNRAKNGDHYWVRATVSPITRGGEVVGYISFRKKPTREEVEKADALYNANPESPPA